MWGKERSNWLGKLFASLGEHPGGSGTIELHGLARCERSADFGELS